MDTPSIKDYVDASRDQIAAQTRAYYGMTHFRLAEMEAHIIARLAEMETRLLRGQAEVLKWCIGIMLTGLAIIMTVTTSISVYLYTSTQGQIQSLAQNVDALGREVRALRPAINPGSDNR
ncbi:hypothetical protein GJ698_02520 [Pseudoduganella sp. FT26W]|uniref:Uncharacterized protein n=1 Tax=Duganella aquatilis TaxID=2666082 RepID=A0A844CRQ2_9BURK|nr:hypothetical protein [Duganella aquatilis]MRW82963.1 hypothetical protein [Duganella aquatilis]